MAHGLLRKYYDKIQGMIWRPKEYKQAQRSLRALQKQADALKEDFEQNNFWDRFGKEARGYEAVQTDALLNKARQLGVEIPSKPEWWWDDLDYELPRDSRSYLTPEGKLAISALIGKAQKENIEWWVKTVGGILAGLTGLAGTIIGIIAILSK